MSYLVLCLHCSVQQQSLSSTDDTKLLFHHHGNGESVNGFVLLGCYSMMSTFQHYNESELQWKEFNMIRDFIEKLFYLIL